MSLYGSFSHEEAHEVGKKLKVRCNWNGSYERSLTVGKEYEVEVTPAILPLSPLCKGIGDNGEGFECHLERFEKV